MKDMSGVTANYRRGFLDMPGRRLYIEVAIGGPVIADHFCYETSGESPTTADFRASGSPVARVRLDGVRDLRRVPRARIPARGAAGRYVVGPRARGRLRGSGRSGGAGRGARNDARSHAPRI